MWLKLQNKLASTTFVRLLIARQDRVGKVWWERVSDTVLGSNKHFIWRVLTPLGCSQRPLPATTEPAGQVWLTWHCSLDSCCDCQHMKSLAVFSFFTRVPFDSSTESQNLLTGSVPGSVFASPSGRLDGGRMQNANPCFRLLEVHVYTLKSVGALIKNTDLTMCDIWLYKLT